MSEYIPPCEIHIDEAFGFDCEVVDVEDNTGNLVYNITENPKCSSCFLRENCIQNIAKILGDIYDLSTERIEIEGMKEIVRN